MTNMQDKKQGSGSGTSRAPTLDGYEVRKCSMPQWAFVRRFIYPKERLIWVNAAADPDANIDWVEW